MPQQQSKYREIRSAEDVREEHVEIAADCRDGLYGNIVLTWDETVTMVERTFRDEDWGSDMESDAIRYLKREVRRVLRDRG